MEKKKEEQYKGYTIKVAPYLGEFNESCDNCYFDIEKDGKLIYSTLFNDDKMWTLSSGIEAAKREIDEMEK